MELNFNSVEMSREPRAEASSLDYAEAKLTFNSVETIPSLNASAAFFSPSLEQLKGQVDSGKVFKEDVDMVPTIIDKSLSYMPWGGDKRELYTIAQAQQKPYHDLIFTVHQMIIRLNGWQGCKVDVPFIQLTTLDEHRDAREVTLQVTDE